MHSRIFQVETKPVKPADYTTSEGIPDWFLSEVADYVNDIKAPQREGNLTDLARALSGICTRDGDQLKMGADFTEFFSPYFSQFQEAVQQLATITLSDFAYSERVGGWIYDLRSAYDDNRGFFIWTGDDLYTMHAWVRHIAKPLNTYYLGGVIDYHF